MFAYQLDLFEEYSETSAVEERVRQCEHAQDKLRKGLFARHNELSKQYLLLLQANEKLERRLAMIEKNLSS